MELNNTQHKFFLWHLIFHCAFRINLGESIMFSSFFSLALKNTGTKTNLTSSLLFMAIAFLIPLVCYGVIGTYALSKRHVPL